MDIAKVPSPEWVQKYPGVDNFGRLRSQYLAKILNMTNEELESETGQMIYHSARCHNRPRADWHWMVAACYDECGRRDQDMYKRVYDRTVEAFAS